MSKQFGDWRDELRDEMVAIFMAELEAVEPQVRAAREAGDIAEATAITRSALEKAAVLAAELAEAVASREGPISQPAERRPDPEQGDPDDA